MDKKPLVLGTLLTAVSFAAGLPKAEAAPAEPVVGTASWYSRTDRGIKRLTASGERFDDSLLTCASRRYPIGTYLKVTNKKTGKSVICRVNDRGPHKRLKREIDLTKASFRQIANPKHGLAKVSITKHHPPKTKAVKTLKAKRR